MAKQQQNWHAIYTKARSEKKVAERLEKQGIEVYCPTFTTLRQWSDRKKKVTMPVFNSYVFVKVTEQERNLVLQDMGVMNFIFWLGKPAIIKEDEIDQLKQFLGEYQGQELTIKAVSPGDTVTLKQGAFAGEKGKVAKVGNKKVYVLLESVGLIVETTIESTN